MITEDSTTVVPLTTGEQIKGRIQNLLDALQKNLPNYESLLHTIHRNLATDPDTVHLLTEEEIGIICAGLSKRTGIFIAQIEEKKSGGGKGRKGKVQLEEL